MGKLFINFICLLIVLFSITTYSQVQNEKDSLLVVIENSSGDSTMIATYKSLISYYLKSNIDSAIFYASEGLSFAKRTENNYGLGSMYHSLGHAMVVRDSLEKAKAYYLKAIEYFKRANKLSSQSTVYMVLGNVFLVQDKLPEALTAYIEGKKIADSLKLIDNLHHFYNNMGAVYYNLEDYQLALENFNNAFRLSESANDIETSVYILTNMSDIYVKLKDYDQAKLLNEQALQIVSDFSLNEAFRANIYSNKGDVELNVGNYHNAILNFKKAIHVADKIGPGYLAPLAVEMAHCRVNLGKSYYEIGDIENATRELITSFDIAQDLSVLGTQKEAAFYLSKIYDRQGNIKKAFDFYKIFNALSDSISNENTTKKITQLKMQFEFDKTMRAQEVERTQREMLQRKKEVTLYVIIGGVLLGLLIFLLLYLLQKNKSKRIHLERQNLTLDLENKNKELTTNVMYLLKKNEFIDSISDKLKKTKLYFKPENRTFVDNIVKELESSLSKDTWEEFELRFQNVHSKFYEKLNEMHPNLSPNELKLCAFLRLNMTTKEIASITYQSPKSINVARYRLRKKMGLDEHANLISFLSQL